MLNIHNAYSSSKGNSKSNSISENDGQTPYPLPPAPLEKEQDLNIGESKISKTLSEKTTKTVIILILTMLFLL